jgi:hypothetical protein
MSRLSIIASAHVPHDPKTWRHIGVGHEYHEGNQDRNSGPKRQMLDLIRNPVTTTEQQSADDSDERNGKTNDPVMVNQRRWKWHVDVTIGREFMPQPRSEHSQHNDSDLHDSHQRRIVNREHDGDT